MKANTMNTSERMKLDKEKESERRKMVASLVILTGALVILFGRYAITESFFPLLLTGFGLFIAGMYRFERTRWKERNELIHKEGQVVFTR